MIKEVRIYNGRMTATSINSFEKMTATCNKIKLDYFLMSYMKINPKWIKSLNVKLEIIRFLEENIGNPLTDIILSRFFFFFAMSSWTRETKAKINKLDYQFSSVQFSHSVMSDSLRPHESQHARPPCPSPTPGVHPDSRPSSQ